MDGGYLGILVLLRFGRKNVEFPISTKHIYIWRFPLLPMSTLGEKQNNPVPIFVESPNQLNINRTQLKKMVFVMNALDKGWSVKKRDDEYIFTKKHENLREVFRENYLETFIHSNFEWGILRKLGEE